MVQMAVQYRKHYHRSWSPFFFVSARTSKTKMFCDDVKNSHPQENKKRESFFVFHLHTAQKNYEKREGRDECARMETIKRR